MVTRWQAVVIAVSATLLGAGAVSGQGLAQPTPERFVLSGVIILDGERGWAWLEEPRLTGNQVVAVRIGGTIGPYRLTRVFDDRVELDGPTGKVLIPLYTAGSGGGSSAVASAASGPSAPAPTPSQEPASAGSIPGATLSSASPAPAPPAWRSRAPERGRTPDAATAKQVDAEVRAKGESQLAKSKTRGEEAPNGALNNPNALNIPIGDSRRMAVQTLFGGR